MEVDLGCVFGSGSGLGKEAEVGDAREGDDWVVLVWEEPLGVDRDLGLDLDLDLGLGLGREGVGSVLEVVDDFDFGFDLD